MSKINWQRPLTCDAGPVTLLDDRPAPDPRVGMVVRVGVGGFEVTYVVCFDGRPKIDGLAEGYTVCNVSSKDLNRNLAIEICKDIAIRESETGSAVFVDALIAEGLLDLG